MSRRQIPLINRDMLGYYSRAEMSLILGLLVLESQGYEWASIRALSAFFGHTGHALYVVTHKAHENGLIEIHAIPRNRYIRLTTKGKEIVNAAIGRVRAIKVGSGVEQAVSKVS